MIDAELDTRAASAAPCVFTRHNGIPGRVRLQIAGLRGNYTLKERIERIGSANGIRDVSASAITGNVLVFYDPAKQLPEIVGYLEIVLRRPTPSAAKQRQPEKSAPAGIWKWIRDLWGRGL